MDIDNTGAAAPTDTPPADADNPADGGGDTPIDEEVTNWDNLISDDDPILETPADEASPKEGEKEEDATVKKEDAKKQQETKQTAKESVAKPTEQELLDFQTKNLGRLEQMYSLPEDVAKAFEEEPAKMLPKILARVHHQANLEAHMAFNKLMQEEIPKIAGKQITAQQGWQQFATKYPDLANHREALSGVAKAYKAANPNKAGAEAETAIIAMTRTMLGIQAPSGSASSVQKKAAPHKPAGQKAPAAAKAAADPADMWADLL